MRWHIFAALSASPILLSAIAALGAAPAPTQDAIRVTGPAVHENLTVYFIRGQSAPGKVPLTLEEALAKGTVKMRETGNVNQLEVENVGNNEVFIQAGDIVKGGQQDRTLMVSLVLPPKSGRVPIASFCVEQGRWSGRGREDVKNFSTSAAAVPSREMKIAMKAPTPTPVLADPVQGQRAARYAASDTSARQSAVWEGVRKIQDKLTGSVGAVRSTESASSLQLALESEKLIDAQRAYVNAIKAAGETDTDIIGYVFAVNGKLNSADVYPSNGLFRKMWVKLLNASAIEAIGHKDEAREAAPSTDVVMAFLTDAERGKANATQLNAGVKLDTREGDQAYYFETARAAGWVHRNYLAK